MVARADAFGQQRERTLDVAHEGHVGMDDFVDFGGVDLHMDDPGVGAEGGGVARYAVVETHSDGDEQVALLVFDVGAVVAVHPQHSHVAGVVARQRREAQQRRGGRHAAAIEKGPQFGFGVAQDRSLADHRQRPPGFVDEPRRFLDASCVGRKGGCVAADRGDPFVAEGRRRALGVLGDVDYDGARAPRTGDVEGFGDGRRNLFGVFDLAVPFRDSLRDPDEVGLLKGVGSQQCRTYLSGDEHQRRGVHQRVGQSGHGVRRTRAGGDQADAHAAAYAGIALRGVDGALLVAHEDVAQPVAIVVERVVDGDDRAAGIAEEGLDAFAQKRFDQGLRSGEQRRFGRLPFFGSEGFGRIHIQSVLCVVGCIDQAHGALVCRADQQGVGAQRGRDAAFACGRRIPFHGGLARGDLPFVDQ